MPSNIRPQDALSLYEIFHNPGAGGTNLVDFLNLLSKCLGISSDSSGRGGHSGGNYYVTPTGGVRTQLFSYSTKSYTQEKVQESLNVLRPVVAQLPDENLRRIVNLIATPPTTPVTTADFVAKT